MTTTELVCQAQQIRKCLKCDQSLEMAALIAVFSRLANLPVDCATLNANAAAFACIERQNQLPALIYLATQIVPPIIPANGGFTFSGLGSPVGVVFPQTPAAQYLDYTNPNFPVVWYWSNNVWTIYIGG